MVMDLINNAALILAVCWLQSLITYRWSRKSLKAKLVSGVLFGLGAVIMMVMYIYLMPGLWTWIDASIVIVSVATLLYGPTVGVISALIAASYRLWIGGLFATAGTVNIVIALVMGLLFRDLHRRGIFKVSLVQLLVFGLVAHVAAFLQPFYFSVPLEEIGLSTYVLSVLAVMVPATAILGLQLRYIERKKELEVSVQRSEARLRAITEAIPDQLVVFSREGRFLDVLAPSALVSRAADIIGKTISEVFADKSAAQEYQNLVKRVSTSGQTEKGEHSSFNPYPLPSADDGGERTFESKAGAVNLSQTGDAVLVLSRDITDRRRAEERVRYLAYYDPLTGLPNRHLMRETLEQFIRDAKLNRQRFAVLMVSLDRFKLFNEIYGFSTGDIFLKEIGNRLRRASEGEKMLVRYAGDQFLVAVDLEEGNDNAESCCQRILSEIAVPFDYQGEKIVFAASVGIAIYPDDAEGMETLIRYAISAVEWSRKSGSVKYSFYNSEMEIAARQELDIRNALAQAMDNGEFELFYQPIVDIATGDIDGVEALLRWNHPRVGVQDPAYFMSVAEETGLIVPMGEWVVREACRQGRAWLDAGLSFGAMSVNISTAQLERSRLESKVAEILDEVNLPHQFVHLEVSESSLLHTLENAFLATDQLKAQGIKLAIDNFGTGYSRFDSLRRLNIARLKLDKRFIGDLTENEESRAMVSAMIQMAKALKLETVAMGVENEQTMTILKQMGCDGAQGYYFTRPLNAGNMEHYLRQHPGGEK